MELPVRAPSSKLCWHNRGAAKFDFELFVYKTLPLHMFLESVYQHSGNTEIKQWFAWKYSSKVEPWLNSTHWRGLRMLSGPKSLRDLMMSPNVCLYSLTLLNSIERDCWQNWWILASINLRRSTLWTTDGALQEFDHLTAVVVKNRERNDHNYVSWASHALDNLHQPLIRVS